MSIADHFPRPTAPPQHRAFVLGVAGCASLVGLAAAWWYASGGLTLSHYDAKAHLVVARRIFDSLTPGWRQIGAVWLPLPHLLNALPVQIDGFYRTGASGVAMSIACFVVTTATLAWIVVRATRSRAAAAAAATVFATDPNVLYLQATPMTEPLLLVLIVLGTALVFRWVEDADTASPGPAGLALAGACLTRYEAWPVTAALVALSVVALWLKGVPLRAIALRTSRLAAYPAIAILAFLVLSRATVGEWFVTGGFYVPDNKAHGRPLVAAASVWWGLRRVAGTVTVLAGVAGLAGLLLSAWRKPAARGALLVLPSLTATAALPWYAFVSGHPFRIRYMVVLVAAVAACAGIGVGLLRRGWRPLAAAALTAVAVIETPPLSSRAPMVQEAQWDRPFAIGRREVTRCLAAQFARPEDKILASMGSLAHYMQELSHAGFALGDFVHEGIGELWPEALAAPHRHVRWILFEERAEGGDMLTAMRRQRPSFVDGFARACEGGGVALYRKVP